ncbi:MAG: HTH-type transcriptional regulator CdhR [Paracidovorax wautersii]|uniref:HTH-type transcriptional regulator CdhR n=1 Tax=Paracidovorax wautersii TaxID=1177982 RepID=A0A7V8JQX1_9BURK|nr:MAG: HTH-type transcriptional regulator CdhR [Paracidovorax wautersii]
MTARDLLPPHAEAAPPIHVHFVLQERSLALDWAGPAEALRVANQLLATRGQPPRFVLHFIGTREQALSSVGVMLCGIQPLPAALPAPSWVVLVGLPGQRIEVNTPAARELIDWLAGLALRTGQTELVTICAGTVLAAHARLLRGRRVTTHHQHLDELARAAPAADVVANRVFVLDEPVCSSAGVTTGIDLMLHRIGALCGEALAAQVAQTLVMPLRRGPHDPELSPFLAGRHHMHPALHRVQDAVSGDVQQDWTASRMAAVACVSSRHLARLFHDFAGMAPLDYLCQIRLAVARQALDGGQSVTRAAQAAGFSSDTQLRRAWRRHRLAGTPSQF